MLAASRAFRLGSTPSSSLSLLSSTIRSKHTLPDLTYDYKALEPVISGEIMELHHKKHHATYVNNLNNAEEQLKERVSSGDGH